MMIIKIACLLNRYMRSNRLDIWINTQISNMERARVMEAYNNLRERKELLMTYSKLEEIEKLFERGKSEEKDK